VLPLYNFNAQIFFVFLVLISYEKNVDQNVIHKSCYLDGCGFLAVSEGKPDDLGYLYKQEL
jgi:hypothetical protein